MPPLTARLGSCVSLFGWLQPWYGCAARNSKVPEEHGLAHPQAPVPGTRNQFGSLLTFALVPQRLVREIAQDFKNDLRFQSTAILALQVLAALICFASCSLLPVLFV